MSLIDDFNEACVLMEKRRVSDERGGFVVQWTDGASFNAAITYDTSVQAKVAEAQGVKDFIKVTTQRGITLEYHDVFRRVSDGQTFRVTSKGENNATPRSAGLDLRQVSAEEYELTGDGNG